VAYLFEWDSIKAIANAEKHGVTFDEASSQPDGRPDERGGYEAKS